MGMGGMMGGFGSGWGGFGLGAVGSVIALILNLAITVALLAGIVLLVMWLWRRIGSTATPLTFTRPADDPRTILQMRYARGEISREQYLEMLNDLQ